MLVESNSMLQSKVDHDDSKDIVSELKKKRDSKVSTAGYSMNQLLEMQKKLKLKQK